MMNDWLLVFSFLMGHAYLILCNSVTYYDRKKKKCIELTEQNLILTQQKQVKAKIAPNY